MPQQGMSGAHWSSAFDLLPIPGFDGLDGVSKCLFQNALADGPEHEAEHPPLEVLALTYHDGVHISRSVRPPCKGVDVARTSTP
jgi:hypothetical protein